MQRRVFILALAAGLVACDVDAPTDLVAEPQLSRSEAPGDRKPVFRLTLLHNNDGESALLPGPEFGGIARFASIVDGLRSVARESCPRKDLKCDLLLVSSGDNFLAGPQFNASLENGVPFYDGIALDQIGYDALAIGNHEFDFGPDVLADFIESFPASRAPFLSANLSFRNEPRLARLDRRGRIARSSTVHTRGGRVGIIGATTPLLSAISSPRNTTISQDVARAINGEARRLKLQGVEHIILISHLQSIAEDQALIPSLRGIDIAVAGGGDNLLANPDDVLIPGDVAENSYPLYVTDAEGVQVPVITTSGAYRYVGRLVVDFDKRGAVVSVSEESGPVRVEGVGDPTIQAEIEAPVAASVAALASNVIGTTEVALDGLRSAVRTRETNQGNLVTDAFLRMATDLAPSFGNPVPDIALQNGGGMRDDEVVPAGTITELKTYDILPFANFLSVAAGVTRAQLKEILENAVSRVEVADGRFAQVAGMRFEYSTSGTPMVTDISGTVTQVGTRVQNAWLDDGTPLILNGAVVPGPDLTVATIDFLLRSGDQYPFRAIPFTTLGLTYQQALEQYIEGPLGGLIGASDYPAGGEGRIVRIP